MAYKTCEDCGCRIFEYGCVNCNEQDYIDMQGAYDSREEVKVISSNPPVISSVCPLCEKNEKVEPLPCCRQCLIDANKKQTDL